MQVLQVYMTVKRKKIIVGLLFVLVPILFTACRNHDRSWSMYKADAASSSYSPLKQISRENVSRLQPAWTFYPADAVKDGWPGRSQCNPIVIDGVMYASSARHRIYAIDAGNGKMIWSFDPFDGGPGGGSFRGVTYWEDGTDKRILFTGGDILFALNAKTGKPVTAFGTNGKVSMNIGMRGDPSLISIKPTSPGIIYKDLLIIGNEVSELYNAEPGYVRAYNVRNGKLEWTFHTVPLPGETGYETWPKDAWKYAGGCNDWGGLSVDEKRGLVFLATGSPAYDFYGADREGMNLFGNCVVALDAQTGKLKWYFQTVHHDLWDYDLSAPPNLVTVERQGKKIDAVAQTSKTGFLYVLDRETGSPLFPIKERKVPASDVPGEKTWPTQPFPLKPKPYAKQFITKDDLADFSPAAHDSLVKWFDSLRYEGLFTPPSVKGTFVLPATIGGAEWGGAAFDPATNVLYVKSNESPEIDQLQKIDLAGNRPAANGYEQGKNFYTTYCVSCHKADRKGEEPLYPSLIDIKKRMTEADVLKKIKEGSGKMPGFGGLLNGQDSAIIDFLFDKRNRQLEQEEESIAEIKRNSSSFSSQNNNKQEKDTVQRYLNVRAYEQLRGSDGHPVIKPPWGTLNAINLNTGNYEWTVPAGNIPELQEKNGPLTGATSSPGPIVTAGGLVFLGGTRDRKLQAFDKTTGKLVWETTLPGPVSSTPCTFLTNGKQYVAVSVGGNKESPAGFIMAFALP